MTYGDEFQEKSKYSRNNLSGITPDFTAIPDTYKSYPASHQRIELETPNTDGGASLYEVLKKRRSVRDYKGKTIDMQTLSLLLWAAQGITLNTAYHQFRTAPSAGGLYPVETYVAVNNVEGLQSGIYHYEVLYHTLALLEAGNMGRELARAGLGQNMLADAPVVFIFSAVIQRCRWKYGQRAYRYIYMDAGHIAQNLALAAVSCDLGSCQIGAFLDEEVNGVVGLDGQEETVIYMSTVG